MSAEAGIQNRGRQACHWIRLALRLAGMTKTIPSTQYFPTAVDTGLWTCATLFGFE